MYCKRILILNSSGKIGANICGMVKFVNSGEKTNLTVFVSNCKNIEGEWWLLVAFGKKCCSFKLGTMNNEEFAMRQESLENVGCLLVNKSNYIVEVCRASTGDNSLCDLLKTNVIALLEQTNYEKFVEETGNYYPEIDIDSLKNKANSRYKSVEEYSSAFDRFYASGSIDNYYNSVSKEISKLFVCFPPYYPLMQKYKKSYFVRIDFPSSEKYFVLGLLQSENKVKYICYGMPATGKEVGDKDFVYIDNSPTSFWMLFQDADSGQITTLSKAV